MVVHIFAALMLVGTAAAAFEGCMPKINWFPTYNQISTTDTLYVVQSDGITALPCKGNSVCNSPPVWSLVSQSAAADATNSAGLGEVFNVAFKQYHTNVGSAAQPSLYFIPSSPVLDGASLASCTEGTLTTSGSWSYTVSFATGSTAVAGERVGNAGRIQVPQLPWADNESTCATITITVSGYSVRPTPAGLPPTLVSSHQVCWYRHNGQASADFEFAQCSEQFAVNVTNIQPLAQFLQQNGDAIADTNGDPALLFQPVIQIFGSMHKTVNGTALLATPEYNGEGAVYVINKYLIVPPETTAKDVITVPLDTGDLAEGYYQLNARVSVISKFPGLVDLQGSAVIVQEDIQDVAGYTEYMGTLARNGSNESYIGFQRQQRIVQLSDISSNKVGEPIAAGDSITFRWQFYGVGSQRCYHDGERLAACNSPATVTAKPFNSTAAQHTFEVVITDVCGNNNSANFTYAAQGVSSVSIPDFVDSSDMVEAGRAMLTTVANSSLLSVRLSEASNAIAQAATPVAWCVATALLLLSTIWQPLQGTLN